MIFTLIVDEKPMKIKVMWVEDIVRLVTEYDGKIFYSGMSHRDEYALLFHRGDVGDRTKYTDDQVTLAAIHEEYMRVKHEGIQ